jgi:molybdopterin molybdotransferase
MQPGKPQGFGHIGNGVPIFCLPGNPVSSLVSFEVFVRPAIRHLLGKRSIHRATVQATALESASSRAGVRQYRRGVLHREATGSYSVSLVGGPGSHLIASMALANCLVVIEEEVTTVEVGSPVTVIPLLLSNR